MPEYILDMGSADHARAFKALDAFTQGYIEALFFTENAPNAPDAETFAAQCEAGENEGSIPADCGFADLAPEALEAIVQECGEFQSTAASLLERAYTRNYDAEQAGRDFWFTRNGHGVGFWDRQVLREGGLGDALSALCGWRTGFGEVDVYFGDDGLVHVGGA